MANDFSMNDIAGLLGVSGDTIIKNSTSRKGNTELNMDDFLQLMIVQLTSQTIDDTMDTSEMINQMVQMQMVSALANMTDASVQNYATSLVGKVVTIGIVKDNVLEEREIVVMGTGTMNGQRVIFGSDGEIYYLNQIMAVGRLPNEDGTYGPQDPGDSEGEDGDPDKVPDAGDVDDPNKTPGGNNDDNTTTEGAGGAGGSGSTEKSGENNGNNDI